MKLTLSPADSRFSQQAQAFVESHWLQHQTLSADARLQAWQTALCEQGWSVPDWPLEYGGCGWSATQKYLWHSICAQHHAPAAQPFAHGVVARLLFALADSAATGNRRDTARQWLDGLRNYQSGWCIGLQDVPARPLLMHSDESGNWRLHGAKTGVTATSQAHWLCCLVTRVEHPPMERSAPHQHQHRQQQQRESHNQAADKQLHEEYWVALSLAEDGIDQQVYEDLHGAQALRLEFSDVVVPHSHILAPARDAFSAARLLCDAPGTLYQSVWLQAQLAMLKELVMEFSDEEGLQQRLREAGVAVEGLQALENRYAQALQQNAAQPAGGPELPFPAALLVLRSEEIFLQLGQLQMETFGYYALPYPDRLLSHNEGPVGPPMIIEAMDQVMATRTSVMGAEFNGMLGTLKDQLADQLSRIAPFVDAAGDN